jgi:uncharacterized membrane protein YfhO
VLKSIERKNWWQLAAGALLILLSYFFYHTPRLFIPVFFGICSLYYGLKNKPEDKKIFFSFLVVFVCATLLSVALFFTSFGSGRFSQISIFSSNDITVKAHQLSDAEQ